MTSEIYPTSEEQGALTRKILIVEDNPADARLITEALAEAAAGLSVTVVNDGESALERLEETVDVDGPPSLILLDLDLPGMSGHEVLRELRARSEFGSIPTVVMSGSDLQEDIDVAYEAGANAFVTKPNALDQFLEVAQSLTTFWFCTATLPSNE